MTRSSVPTRGPILPPEKPHTGAERASVRPAGSGAIRLNNLRQANPTGITQPEMKAVRPSQPSIRERDGSLAPENDTGRQSSSPNLLSDYPGNRASWADAAVVDPITEPTGRATEVGPPPSLLGARDRALLLRMDGVHAGQVVPLEHSLTIGRHPNNGVVIDDTGVSRYHAEIHCEGEHIYLKDLGARNGTIVQGHAVTGVVELHDGDFIQFGPRVGFRFSLTDLKQEKLLQRLYESSNRDALTGAYNRKHFDERLLSELAYAARHQSSTALLLFDIDHFKKVNDTYGHAAGDAVLRQVSGIAQSRLRTEDVFARIGGEEFAVLLRGVNLQGSVRLAERLRTSVSSVATLYEQTPVPVTISIGCASTKCEGGELGDQLIRLADERLYRAKNGGRNRVVSE